MCPEPSSAVDLDPTHRDVDATDARACIVHRLGTVDYTDACRLQRRWVRAVSDARDDAHLLLLEHPPVITIGRSGAFCDVHLGARALLEKGMTVHYTPRGGQVTLHAPGQLIGYMICPLDDTGVRTFLRRMEEWIIAALGALGVNAHRERGRTGIWLGEKKICALGLAVNHWVTYHGFALNVSNDLALFETIVPCGATDRSVTSVSAELGREVARSEVEEALVSELPRIFGRKARWSRDA